MKSSIDKIGSFLAWMNAGGQVSMKYGNPKQEERFKKELSEALEAYLRLDDAFRKMFKPKR
jgi:hypothetical protein